MRIKIIRDTAITVVAGQTVETKDAEARRAIKLGYAELVSDKKRAGEVEEASPAETAAGFEVAKAETPEKPKRTRKK